MSKFNPITPFPVTYKLNWNTIDVSYMIKDVPTFVLKKLQEIKSTKTELEKKGYDGIISNEVMFFCKPEDTSKILECVDGTFRLKTNLGHTLVFYITW